MYRIHSNSRPIGVSRGRLHPVGLSQKQSNQPVFGQFLSNFIIHHPVAPPVAWNSAYTSVPMPLIEPTHHILKL